MKKCLKCGALLDDDAVFCAECGTNELIKIENEKPPVSKRRCPVCGEALEEDSRFCTNCGAKLEQKPVKPVKPEKPEKPKKPEKPEKPKKPKKPKEEKNINKSALKGVIAAVLSVILAAAIGVGGYFIGKVSSPSNNKEINEALCSGRWVAMEQYDSDEDKGLDPYFDFVVFHKDGMCSFFTDYAGYRIVNDAVVLDTPTMYDADEWRGGKPTYDEYIFKFNEDKSVLTMYGRIGKEYNGDNIRYFLVENANGKDFREHKLQYYDTFDECYNALMESVNESKIDDEYRLVRF